MKELNVQHVNNAIEKENLVSCEAQYIAIRIKKRHMKKVLEKVSSLA
jgi:hypothetical protein